jgi:AcrR family transcriptional regulator
MGLGKRLGKLKPGPGASAPEVAAHQRDRIHNAMLELVTGCGYGAVTVRSLAGRARISTRTFYQHYSGKEDCFLAVYDLVARRMLSRLTALNREAALGGRQLSRVITTIIREWDRDPIAARLMLIDVYDAGPAAIERAQRTTRSLETRIFGSEIPSVIARGILAGIIGITQKKLLHGVLVSVQDTPDDLVEWALACLSSGSASHLEELSLISAQASRLDSFNASNTLIEPIPDGHRALLILAAEKLVAENCECVTEKSVWDAAGVPRRVFAANFSCLDECLALIIDRRIEWALSLAKRAGERSPSAAGRVYRGVEVLCQEIAQDSVLQGICFGEVAGWDATARLRRQMELRAKIVRFISEEFEASVGAGKTAVEASIGAFWGLVHREVLHGNAASLSRMTVPLAYLILAPAIGSERAIAVIRSELNYPARKTYKSQLPGRKSIPCMKENC